MHQRVQQRQFDSSITAVKFKDGWHKKLSCYLEKTQQIYCRKSGLQGLPYWPPEKCEQKTEFILEQSILVNFLWANNPWTLQRLWFSSWTLIVNMVIITPYNMKELKIFDPLPTNVSEWNHLWINWNPWPPNKKLCIQKAVCLVVSQ